MSADSDFDPYRKWLGIPVEQQPPTHYRLLGLADFEKDPDVIDNACERCSAHVKTFAAGEYADVAKRIVKELRAAKDCLLDPKARKVYDAELRKCQPAASPVEASPSVPAIPVAPVPTAQAIPVSSPAQPSPASPLAEIGSGRGSASGRAYKMRRKQSSTGPWLLILGMAAFLLAVGVIYALTRSSGRSNQNSISSAQKPEPKQTTIKVPSQQPKRFNSPVTKKKDFPEPAKPEKKFDDQFDQPPRKDEPKETPKPEVKTEEPAPQPGTTRLAIPDGEPLQAARRWLRENYRLPTKTLAEKKSALEALIEAAGNPTQVPAQRYVLLQRAGELASELIDLKNLTLLNRELAKRFEADYYKLQADALAQAERKATSPEQGRDLYMAAGELLEESRELRRYDAAVAATEVAARSARRAGDFDAQRSAEDLQRELKAKLSAQQSGTEPGPLEKLPPSSKSEVPKLKTSGLIHHWKFDEAQGNEVLCSITNRRSPIRGNPRWISGRVRGSLELSPGTFVEVVEGPQFDKNDTYTLAAWIKTSHTEPMAIIARTDDDQDYRGFDLSMIGLVPYAVLVNKHPGSSIVTAGTQAFSSDEWHHLAATYDGSGQAAGLKLYVDGKEQTLNIQNDSLDASTQTDAPFHIGQRKNSLKYTGLVDDVRIYNRALTAAEIVALVKEAGDPPP